MENIKNVILFISKPVRIMVKGNAQQNVENFERILHIHWPQSSLKDRITTSRMVVLAGDGMLREAFRVDPRGDAEVLAESKLMLGAYIRERLGTPAI